MGKLYLSFSARNHGNCESIAKYLMNEKDSYIAFKDLAYHSCSKCEYECFKEECKYRQDDIYKLLDSFYGYDKIIFLVPMYCGNPSSLYFILSERMQDYFNHNEEKYDSFLKKLFIIGIFGSQKENLYFLPVLSSWFKKEEAYEHVLGIERHLYNQKMNDSILNDETKRVLDSFFKKTSRKNVKKAYKKITKANPKG
ncbi:MAG: NAD(P)H-dependent oxidoreductase [Anaeroplasmataceae bacterium]|nr:NAD(P)H-dependent oxidoreductase [Anaeroplasmataceae bacterium]